jgi:hypothetical protein
MGALALGRQNLPWQLRTILLCASCGSAVNIVAKGNQLRKGKRYGRSGSGLSPSNIDYRHERWN